MSDTIKYALIAGNKVVGIIEVKEVHAPDIERGNCGRLLIDRPDVDIEIGDDVLFGDPGGNYEKPKYATIKQPKGDTDDDNPF